MAAGKTYEQIAWTQFNGTPSSVTFSSISSAYTDLVLILGNIAAASETLIIQVNGDTGTNYSQRWMVGNGSAASSNSLQSNNSIYAYGTLTVPTSIPSMGILNFMSYSSSYYKTILSGAALDQNGSGAVFSSVGLWRNTAAINSITVATKFGTSFVSGGTAALYGIKSA